MSLAVKSVSGPSVSTHSSTSIGPTTCTGSRNGAVWNTRISDRDANGRYGGVQPKKSADSTWSNAPTVATGSRLLNAPPMVGFGPLANDAEIAAVISFVRQSFGNDLDFVKADDVKRIREQTKDRNIFYMVDDILKENPLGKKNPPKETSSNANPP